MLRNVWHWRVFDAQEDDILQDNLGAFFLDAFRRFPEVGLQVTLDIGGFALLDVLTAKLREAVPRRDIVILRQAVTLAVLVLPNTVRAQAEGANVFAAGDLTKVGIAGDGAEQRDFVDGFHDG